MKEETTIARETFLKALKKVKPGIASKDIVESLTYFFFSGKNIVTYNDKISIQQPFSTPFSVFVKADDLYNVVSRATGADMTLTIKEDTLHIKAKRLNVKLATIDDPEFLNRTKLVSKSLKKAKWKVLPNNFMDCIELCAFAAASIESEYTLSCVKVEDDACVASDNVRIAIAKLSVNDGVDNVGLMYLKATEIKNITSIEPTYYAISKAWIHFKNEDNCIFSIRKINGTFPDFSGFTKFKGTKIILPRAVMEGLDIASIFSDDEKPKVDITIKDNKCLVSVKSVGGESAHRSKIKYKGSPINFAINPDFLKEMMNHSTTIIITDDKVRLETENFVLVTSLTTD